LGGRFGNPRPVRTFEAAERSCAETLQTPFQRRLVITRDVHASNRPRLRQDPSAHGGLPDSGEQKNKTNSWLRHLPRDGILAGKRPGVHKSD
jgi:hypothetical protein